MNAPAEDIKDLLDGDTVLGLAYGTNLFVGEMPETPDECVCVYDTPGREPEADFNYERPTVQVRIRGNRGQYLQAQELGQRVRDSLNGRHNETVGSTRIIGIWTQSDVMFIGFDGNHRPLFSVNMRIHRTEVTP